MGGVCPFALRILSLFCSFLYSFAVRGNSSLYSSTASALFAKTPGVGVKYDSSATGGWPGLNLPNSFGTDHNGKAIVVDTSTQSKAEGAPFSKFEGGSWV